MPTKSRLTDLNNHLFAQLERLNDEDLNGEKLTEEIERSRAITVVSREIIANGNLVLQARKAVAASLSDVVLPAMLEDGPSE